MSTRTSGHRPARVLRTLAAARAALIRHTTDETRLGELCRALVETGPCHSASVALSVAADLRLVARAEMGEGGVTVSSWRTGEGPVASPTSATATGSGRPCQTGRASSDRARAARGGDAAAGDRSAIAVPIAAERRAVGALEVTATSPEAFTASDVEMLTEVATDLASSCQVVQGVDRPISERLLNIALDEVGEGIFLMEGDSPLFCYVNRSAAESLGYSRAELTGGMGVLDIDSQGTPAMWADLIPIIRARRRMVIETTHRTRDGRLIPVEVTGNYFVAEGRTYNMAIVRDVSERKAAEAALRESETLYRSLVEAMAEGAVFQDAQGRITAVNPAAERIEGRSAAAMMGQTSDWEEWGAVREDGSPFPGDEHPSMVTLRTGVPQSNVVMGIRRPDGERRWISINSAPLRARGEASPHAVVTTFHDVTDRKQAEAAVLAREAEYRTLADNTPDVIVRWDRDLHRVYANPAFARALRVDPARLVGPLLGREFHPDVARRNVATIAELERLVRVVFETGESRDAELTWYDAEGLRIIDHRFVAERGPDGRVTTVLGIGRDISRIKESERQFRNLAEHLPDVIVRVDPAGRYLYGNHMLEVMTGVPLPDHIGRRMGEVLGSHERLHDLAGAVHAQVAAVCRTRTPVAATMAVSLRDGEHVFDVRLIPEQDDTGGVASVLIVGRDITEWDRAAAALRASEQRFRQVTENIEEVFWLRDAASNEIVYLSPACDRVLGSRERLRADPAAWLTLVHPDDRARVRDAQATQAMNGYDLEYRILRGDEIRWIHDRAFVVRDEDGRARRIAGIAEDVTVRRKLEDQLRHAQKMEAVGQLAGGVAHDFNNLLAVIQMQSSLLLAVSDDPALREEGLREILAASERAANLTRQLLTFSRRQVPQAVDLDIGEVIGTMTRLLRRILGEDVTLETHFAPGLPLIHADPGMMEQVIMNLAVNARDAMPGGGRLTVTLGAVAVAADAAALHPGTLPGTFICLSVSDTGCGIPAASLPHVFEPFFTTKEVGKGTGLGLATVFGIIQQHCGWIDVESRVGEGTTFRVFLPALETAGAPRPVAQPAVTAPRGHETILCVEDEAAVRAIVRTTLERQGYTVLAADAAASARELWKTEADRIDLLVTDVVLPGGVSGWHLADELTAERPGLRVIYTTGYSPDLVDQSLLLHPGRLLLQKPFTASDLARAVRQSLDEPASPD